MQTVNFQHLKDVVLVSENASFTFYKANENGLIVDVRVSKISGRVQVGINNKDWEEL